MSVPFKRSELPAWAIFLIISTCLMILFGGGYLVVKTYFSSKDIHAVVTYHSGYIQRSSENTAITREEIADFLVYSKHYDEYLNEICGNTVNCKVLPPPEVPYPLSKLLPKNLSSTTSTTSTTIKEKKK